MSESYTTAMALVLVVALPIGMMKAFSEGGSTAAQSTGGIGKTIMRSNANTINSTRTRSVGAVSSTPKKDPYAVQPASRSMRTRTNTRQPVVKIPQLNMGGSRSTGVRSTRSTSNYAQPTSRVARPSRSVNTGASRSVNTYQRY